MNDIHIVGLCAPSETDPYGELLLRALSTPGSQGIHLDVCPVPPDLPPHEALPADRLPPSVRALRQTAHRAHALLLAVPEAPDVPPAPLLTALQWLARPAAGAPLTAKPVAVMSVAPGPAEAPEPFTEAEHILLAADSVTVGPRSIVPNAARVLRDQGGPGGRVVIGDPAVTMRLLLHVRCLGSAARTAARLGPAPEPPWI
ncbi:NAD(P)H-dependent oxidoreductase [Streptomyces sp. B-S-A8]|uniref:NAD(P)H-dependent oxidoreductase n=1 Tax=Streptomyces solicavernae TaxID=3043614 RepID=A0ABT6RYR7_9ACTN|nr:NAD(P)H-dependent oxidoreductase [Streptomyces sp. B-S-A8]MDI3389579.1 NAD(P)H-dependent oxidoreductase [Streptomyces sp. B-S-A8]